MKKIADFIVKRKNYIFVTMVIVMIFCAFLIPKVSINYDMSKYLPENSDVSVGLEKMGDNFSNIDSAQVMIKGISIDNLSKVQMILSQMDGIKSVDFDYQSELYYKNDNALFSLTLETSENNKGILDNIRDSLKDYDISIGGSLVNSLAVTETLKTEMPVFLIVAVVLIFIILLLISTSWMEPILFLFISGMAIVINYGTNILFHEISFVTFAIAALLQLALSMDYSIMLLDQFHHEEIDQPKNIAMSKAWVKSFRAITASSLTTIFGLLAMLLMSFTIGRDLGIVLAKGILINVVVVFLTFPTLILIFDKLLMKTKKKSLRIPTNFLSNITYKYHRFITLFIIVITIGAFFVQERLDFSYSLDDSSQESKEILNEFGNTNQFIILYKDNQKSNEVINFAKEYRVNDEKIVSNITDYYNTIAQPISVLELSKLTNIEESILVNVYNLYNQVNQSKLDKIPLNKLLDFITTNIVTNKNYSALFTSEMNESLKQAQVSMKENEKLLISDNYKRMILSVKADTESDEALAFYQELNKISKETFDESYVLGETALASNIESSFADETLLITVVTIISMLIVIAILYRSIGLPVILVMLIQSAIWISICYPVMMRQPLFFIAYIIVECIQMGATIDYAILLSSNYLNNRQKQNKKESLRNALKASIMTIFTSASILIAATFTIAFISSQEMISTICLVIGRGTIISAVVVLFVLPACLIAFDKILEKTTKKQTFFIEKNEKK